MISSAYGTELKELIEASKKCSECVEECKGKIRQRKALHEEEVAKLEREYVKYLNMYRATIDKQNIERLGYIQKIKLIEYVLSVIRKVSNMLSISLDQAEEWIRNERKNIIPVYQIVSANGALHYRQLSEKKLDIPDDIKKKYFLADLEIAEIKDGKHYRRDIDDIRRMSSDHFFYYDTVYEYKNYLYGNDVRGYIVREFVHALLSSKPVIHFEMYIEKTSKDFIWMNTFRDYIVLMFTEFPDMADLLIPTRSTIGQYHDLAFSAVRRRYYTLLYRAFIITWSVVNNKRDNSAILEARCLNRGY
jgi:hypothetical protein